MPRYYFGLDNGERIEDREGLEFADAADATAHAIRTLAQLMAEDMIEGRGIDLEAKLSIVDGSSGAQKVVRLADFIRSGNGADNLS